MLPHIAVSPAVLFYGRMAILAAATAIVAVRSHRWYIRQLLITYFYEGDAE